jgi:ATP-dependent DNA ligase
VWREARLDWGQLQRRLGSAAQIAEQVRTSPASYVAFDVLAVDGVDVRTRPWAARRALLEQLGVDWRPPLQLTPVTFDRDEAEQWSRDYRPLGIEGLVAKGAATRYVPGRASSWLKWKARATEEVIVGAVTGTVERAQAVIAGRLTSDGQLIVVGRSTVLTAARAEQLASVLAPVDPARHPWPEQISSLFGGPPVILRHVDPVVVAEVSADAALQQGRWRHPVRLVRLRPDLVPADVPPFSVARRAT